jgi:uncharacterized protein (DUF1697 family)
MSTKKPLKTIIHIALLRAINVGGRRPVRMAALLDLLTELGFDGAQSLLQSGNLVFRNQERTGHDLEDFLEEEAAKRLQLQADFLVRTAEEWKRIIASNPFQDQAERDAARLVVIFLKCAPSAKDVKALQAAITGPEIVAADGRQAYIVYPSGIGRSRLTNTLIEKKLGTRGTSRNWNTILKLEALASSMTHNRE